MPFGALQYIETSVMQLPGHGLNNSRDFCQFPVLLKTTMKAFDKVP